MTGEVETDKHLRAASVDNETNALEKPISYCFKASQYSIRGLYAQIYQGSMCAYSHNSITKFTHFTHTYHPMYQW